MAVRIGRSRTPAVPAPRDVSPWPSPARVGLIALVGATLLTTDARTEAVSGVRSGWTAGVTDLGRWQFRRIVRDFDTVTLADVAVVAEAARPDRRRLQSATRRLAKLVAEIDVDLAVSEFPVNRLLYDALTTGRTDIDRSHVEAARDAGVVAALAVLARPALGAREFDVVTAPWRARFCVPTAGAAGDRFDAR